LMRSWPVKLATLTGIFVQCIVINKLKRFVQLQDWKESLVGLGENMSMSCHFSGSVSCCGIVAFFECFEPFWVSWTSKRNVQIVSYVSFKIHTLLVLEYGGTKWGFAKGCRFLGNSIEACTDIAHTSPMECGELVWEACRDKDKWNILKNLRFWNIRTKFLYTK
jgi:hypothetical protein